MKIAEQIYCGIVSLLVTAFVLWPWVAPSTFETVLKRDPVPFNIVFAILTVLAVVAVLFVLRDVSQRSFASRAEFMFGILLLALAAPGWIAYMVRYGSRPR